MDNQADETIKKLARKNTNFQGKYRTVFAQHVEGQSPQIAVLTCADSRVIPDFIFNASIGELFVVRVAGNVAIDKTVIESLEYAVDHLQISHLIILGHTHCGAVKAAEETAETTNVLLSEIQESFSLDNNHVLANLKRQLSLLPKRSEIIKKAVEKNSLHLVGALYHLEEGQVEFLD